MSNYQFGAQHYPHNFPSHNPHPHNAHHGRSRRGPRVSSGQNVHRQHYAKPQRSLKEAPQDPAFSAYAKDLEAAKSFDFEDDEIFCPFHLLTQDDLMSIHSSSSSDRSSLSSGSPEGSPVQQQVQPTPSFVLSTPSNFNHSSYQYNAHQQQQPKLHQPLAQRSRNAIPIVDPTTRTAASPPLSVSPTRQMQQQYARRW